MASSPQKAGGGLHSLPVIDVRPFIEENGPSQRKEETGRAVYDACVDTGFFLISHYEAILPQKKVDALFHLMHSFFSLPAETKAQLKGASGRGYFAFGEENLSTIYPEHNTNFEDKDLGDYKEGIDFGPEVDPSEADEFRKLNCWPDEKLLGKEWKQQVLEYFALASELGRVLNRMFAVSLGLPENWFEERMGEPLPTLRLLHYPPSTRMGCGAHSDYGCCAILAQDEAGGLELYNRKNEWVAVEPVPHTLVINIGDMMQRWTNDCFKSTLHRVINPSVRGTHRFSSPFFFEPSPNCLVECIPTCISPGGTAHYAPIRFGDHLRSMYQSTFLEHQE